MSYKYNGFISQQIAPKNAQSIGVYNNGVKICDIPLGRLTPVTKTKQYSFGLVSDMHLWKAGLGWSPDIKFDNALTYFESQGCVFCANCGDITQTGLFFEGDAVNMKPEQFENYKMICDRHTIPVYGICGNHESYVVPITNNLAELKAYTGTDLYYTVTQGNDLFIFIGQPYNVCPMSDEALAWLTTTLEANSNKRCFIFVHPHISSGNPVGAYKSNPLFQNWTHYNTFKRLLSDYPNTILFHGHTHVKFECQEQDKESTYSTADGFKSIHVPSLSRPRDVVNGELVGRDSESQAFVVDVYDGCIVLNGINLINNEPVPTGTFKINT